MILAKVKIKGKAVLAPMAGVTDHPFRKLCKSYGAALVFTEMVSAEGLMRDNRRTEKYMFFEEVERPIGIQLFGANPQSISQAVIRVQGFNPDFIDLNFGCPVRKVIRQGAGAALLNDLLLLAEVCNAAVRASSIPVIGKIRSGWADDKMVCDIAEVLVDCGVSAITIHARTRQELFAGNADWGVIERVKKAVSVPVIGNGDILNEFDAKKMLDQTGCDLVMVGRGALGNPFIFKQINSYLENGRTIDLPSVKERIEACIWHFEEAMKFAPVNITVQRMRKHIGWYLKGIPKAREIRKEIFKYNNAEQVMDKLQSILSDVTC